MAISRIRDDAVDDSVNYITGFDDLSGEELELIWWDVAWGGGIRLV